MTGLKSLLLHEVSGAPPSLSFYFPVCKVRLIADPAFQGCGRDSMRRCPQSPGLGAELLELLLDENMVVTFQGR